VCSETLILPLQSTFSQSPSPQLHLLVWVSNTFHFPKSISLQKWKKIIILPMALTFKRLVLRVKQKKFNLMKVLYFSKQAQVSCYRGRVGESSQHPQLIKPHKHCLWCSQDWAALFKHLSSVYSFIHSHIQHLNG
jgi:hypothetical protein